MNTLGKRLDNLMNRLRLSHRADVKNDLPFSGYEPALQGVRFVDGLSDEELNELNNIVNWNAFVSDSHGRRFGNMAWKGKRAHLQLLPDRRHKLLTDRVDLSNKKVLEIGCFEGIHTVSLCRLAKEVTAVDSRIENVVKTIVRCGFFGVKPTVFKCNVEQWDAPAEWLAADVCHHFGVLYHLKDPVAHLNTLLNMIATAVFLDTHVALISDNLLTYDSEGKTYSYKAYGEGGKQDVFSGMYDHSKWLLIDDIRNIFEQKGFKKFELLEERQERNGPRVLIFASK